MSNDHHNNESKMQAKVLIEDEKEFNVLVDNHETRTSTGDEYIYESYKSYKEYPNSKYILTEDKITVDGVTCYRIKAIRNINTLFGVVAKGSLGGYVESERNLSKMKNVGYLITLRLQVMQGFLILLLLGMMHIFVVK